MKRNRLNLKVEDGVSVSVFSLRIFLQRVDGVVVIFIFLDLFFVLGSKTPFMV
jgi:hypothetical protein